MMAARPNLLRDSKFNALKRQLKDDHKPHLGSGLQDQDQPPEQQSLPPAFRPAEVMRVLAASKERQDRATAQHNGECFERLWALGREPDRLVACPGLHALHISQCRPRRTGPDEVGRRESLLAVEVRAEDIVDVEMVDGWNLCSDETEKGGAEEDLKEGMGDGAEEDPEHWKGDDATWRHSIWVVDADNNNAKPAYSTSGDGYWVEW